MLHVDLIWRNASGADRVIGSVGSNIPAGSDAGAPGGIEADVSGGAMPATCGDLLVMRARLVSGGSPFIELGLGLSIP